MNKYLGLIILVLLASGATAEVHDLCDPCAPGGECVYFLVGQIDPFLPYDCYVLPLVDPCDIAHARDLVEYGLGVGKALIYAAIDYWDVNDGISENRNYLEQGAPAWSWYVTDLIEFTDATIEILDGTPTLVEADLDGWMEMTDGRIGFWSYTVVAEIGTNPASWNCDLDVDGDVDISDLALFTLYWLQSGCRHRFWCGGADLDGNGIVDMNDFATLVRNWLWAQDRIYRPQWR